MQHRMISDHVIVEAEGHAACTQPPLLSSMLHRCCSTHFEMTQHAWLQYDTTRGSSFVDSVSNSKTTMAGGLYLLSCNVLQHAVQSVSSIVA